MRAMIALALLCPILAAPVAAEPCEQSKPGLQHYFAKGWGLDHHNHRLQRETTINRQNVGSLELAWAYGLANEQPRFWPLITEDTVFIGDTGRGLVALDRHTGCERWVREMDVQFASPLIPADIEGEPAMVFGTRMGGIQAVKAIDGSPIWQATIDDQPVPYYSGSPLVMEDRVLVPLSSLEIGLSANPLYGCCTTSGGLAALDLATGEQQWFLPTIPIPAAKTGSRWMFIDTHGPSGAPVWGAPMYDPATRTAFFGTGQNYSHPTTETSDAIFAVDVDTGKPRWTRQFTEGDAYNLACGIGGPNCPEPMGPDLDFGAPPVLVEAGSRRVLIAAQKSSDIHAMDPATGEVIWQQRIGRGGALGGIHWGIAADEVRGIVYIPISDLSAMPGNEAPAPGLYALDVLTGEVQWAYERNRDCDGRCTSGFSAAITATPELVFAGSLDGTLEAVDADTGEVHWSHQTATDIQTVNGVPARGGTIDAHGPFVAGDQVFISSGYGSFRQRPGNAFLVFRLAEDES